MKTSAMLCSVEPVEPLFFNICRAQHLPFADANRVPGAAACDPKAPSTYAAAAATSGSPGGNQIKGPDNPTSQLLPKMSFNGFSGDWEERKDKGGGERSRR